MDYSAMSNQAILRVIGERAGQQRLNKDISQTELANRAGVALIVVQRLESGRGCTLESLIRILRALGKLGQFDALLPEPGPSPIQLAKLKGRERQRASGRRRKSAQPES